jgi:hypothetical protein
MSVDLRELQRFVKQCDPGRPLDGEDDPLYVPFDTGTPVRGTDRRSCVEELERTIIFSEPSTVTAQLFTGFSGTGKTTELRRLKSRLESNKLVAVHPVLVDFEAYVDAFTPISITDVLRVLAYCLDREATLAEGKDPDAEQGYLRRLFEFLTRTEVEVQKIGYAQLGASLMLELKDNPTFRRRTQEALSMRFQQFASEARDTMAEAVVRLRKATHAQQIVVIADSLEKLTPLNEDDRPRIEAAVETVFVQHASWLKLPCHVIYTFPLWLRFRTPQLNVLFDREPQILPMVKIAEPDGGRYAPGFAKLTELMSRRVDIPRIFGDDPTETLARLIAASGGYPRELIRMARETLWTARAFPITPVDVRQIIDRLGEAYAITIREPDVDVLVEVARTHQIPRGDDARLAAFGRLLQKLLVLAYRDAREWYDVHPLVRRAPVVQERLTAAPVTMTPAQPDAPKPPVVVTPAHPDTPKPPGP